MILTCFITPPATNMELAFPFCPPSPAKWRGPVFLAVFLVDSKCLVDLPKSASHIGTSKLGKPELNSVGNRSEFWSTPLPFRGFPNDEFTISIGVLDIYHLILSMFMINPGKPSILFFSSHFSGLLGWTFWSFMVLWHCFVSLRSFCPLQRGHILSAMIQILVAHGRVLEHPSNRTWCKGNVQPIQMYG